MVNTCGDLYTTKELITACIPVGIYCDSLRAPQNGSVFVSSVTPGTDLDSTAEYSCDDKYRLVGERVRMCQASGQWTGEPPVCESMQTTTTFQFAANEDHCHVLLTGIYGCGHVQDPENGWVNITGAERNATAEYYCTEGYRLVNGSQTRTCGEDQWTGIAPTCQGKFATDFNPPNKTYIHTDRFE